MANAAPLHLAPAAATASAAFVLSANRIKVADMTPEELARILSKDDASRLRSSLDALDDKELELFSLLGQGYSSSQIHSEFGFRPKQLKELKLRIRKKLGLKSDMAVARLAARKASDA